MVVKFNKMVYPVLTKHQYVSFLATCFGCYKTIFRIMLTMEVHSVCTYIMGSNNVT